MTLMTVPIIDIAPYWTGAEVRKRAVAQKIDEACRDIGFLVDRRAWGLRRPDPGD